MRNRDAQNHCGGTTGAVSKSDAPSLEFLVEGVKTGEAGAVKPGPEGFVPVPMLDLLRFSVLVRLRRPVAARFVLVRPKVLPREALDAPLDPPKRVPPPACAPAEACGTAA
jgi:hypothetical protein